MYPSCFVFYHFSITIGELQLVMVYTTLLEPYTYPTIVPIEVTVLRGARRLRLSSALRRKYNDFIPKAWNIMAKLGYQKYLQRIYVGIESENSLTSNYYQLPIITAILESVGMLRLKQPLYAIGKFTATHEIELPEHTTQKEFIKSELSSVEIPQHCRIERYLNLLQIAVKPAEKLYFDLTTLFPGVAFENNKIDITRTTIDNLKKIPIASYKKSDLSIDIMNEPLQVKKIDFLQNIPSFKSMTIKSRKCFCGKKICICLEKDRNLHTEQLHLLKCISEYGS